MHCSLRRRHPSHPLDGATSHSAFEACDDDEISTPNFGGIAICPEGLSVIPLTPGPAFATFFKG